MTRVSRARVEKLERLFKSQVQTQEGSMSWAVYLETEPTDSVLHKLVELGALDTSITMTTVEWEQWQITRTQRLTLLEQLIDYGIPGEQ